MKSKVDFPEYKAHSFSKSNELELIKRNQPCGCFYCKSIFQSNEITEFIGFGISKTALCPKCEIDSVIGEYSGHPITKEFMQKMYLIWFK
jgi:hypothetical protein